MADYHSFNIRELIENGNFAWNMTTTTPLESFLLIMLGITIIFWIKNSQISHGSYRVINEKVL